MPFASARVDAALTAALASVTHIQLHDGDPGGSGTGNVADGVSRAAISMSGVDSGESEGAGTFEIPGAGGPFTHVSLWTDVSTGTFVASAVLDPQESFLGAGELEVTVTATASSE